MAIHSAHTIIFRVDASVTMGTGHVMRCLTLAEEAKEAGAEIYFLTREHDGHLCHVMQEKGYHVYRLPVLQTATISNPTAHDSWLGASVNDDIIACSEILQSLVHTGIAIDVLVVDHYALDERWEKEMRRYVDAIVVIDDIADRKHDCDVLVDQNLYDDPEKRYRGKVPQHCRMLLGTEYAILRKEFREARQYARVRSSLQHILVFYGGADPTNETEKALCALQEFQKQFPDHDVTIDVVVGSANPHKASIKKVSESTKNCTYHENISYMAELMLKADLALGAGGTTTWERCALGLPAIVTVIAENQREITKTAQKYHCLISLGDAEYTNTLSIVSTMVSIMRNGTLFLLSQSAIKIMQLPKSHLLWQHIFNVNSILKIS